LNIQQKGKDPHFQRQQLPPQGEGPNTSRPHGKRSGKNHGKRKQKHGQHLCPHVHSAQLADPPSYPAPAHMPGCQCQMCLGYSQHFANFANLLDVPSFSPATAPYVTPCLPHINSNMDNLGANSTAKCAYHLTTIQAIKGDSFESFPDHNEVPFSPAHMNNATGSAAPKIGCTPLQSGERRNVPGAGRS